jgi:hypothetical protein
VKIPAEAESSLKDGRVCGSFKSSTNCLLGIRPVQLADDDLHPRRSILIDQIGFENSGFTTIDIGQGRRHFRVSGSGLCWKVNCAFVGLEMRCMSRSSLKSKLCQICRPSYVNM